MAPIISINNTAIDSKIGPILSKSAALITFAAPHFNNDGKKKPLSLKIFTYVTSGICLFVMILVFVLKAVMHVRYGWGSRRISDLKRLKNFFLKPFNFKKKPVENNPPLSTGMAFIFTPTNAISEPYNVPKYTQSLNSNDAGYFDNEGQLHNISDINESNES